MKEYSYTSTPLLAFMACCRVNFTFTFTLHLNPLNAELMPFCHLLALLGAHHILHVSGVRVNEWKHTEGSTFEQTSLSPAMLPLLETFMEVMILTNCLNTGLSKKMDGI